MTTNHVDQLAQWWENAEEGIPSAGDTVIFDERHRGLGFHVTQATKDHPRGYDNARILARAPKPKPAWHDAIAVTATATDDLGDEITAVWVREGDELWRSDEGGMVLREDLRDATPLIEAKVTDEMRDRVRDYYRIEHQVELPRDDVWLNELLTAALGLEAV